MKKTIILLITLSFIISFGYFFLNQESNGIRKKPDITTEVPNDKVEEYSISENEKLESENFVESYDAFSHS